MDVVREFMNPEELIIALVNAANDLTSMADKLRSSSHPDLNWDALIKSIVDELNKYTSGDINV